MKIALLSDAWQPQINGVVRTWTQVIAELEAMGHEFVVLHPGDFRTFRAPRYPEIQLAIKPGKRIARRLDAFNPDVIHVATEGPIGMAGRRYCRRRRLPFTTCYHTQFPHYMRAYYGLPTRLTYRFIRWFHGPAEAVLVPSATVGRELNDAGLDNVKVWCRGVDTNIFKTYERTLYEDLARPIFVNAGRVAREKNIEAFLKLDLPGSKVIVGDGPLRADLEQRYPGVYWAGYRHGEDLARHYADADVFVFPSKTDTFGVVMLEANACGLPVAAYRVTGPIDVVREGETGCLNDDLKQACLDAARLDPDRCIAYAQENSWRKCAEFILDEFVPITAHRSARRVRV